MRVEIVIVDIRREGEDRWVADLRLDETPELLVLKFRPPDDGRSIEAMPLQLEGTREYREVAWLIHRVRKGERLSFPHRVEVGERWPNWPSVNDPPREPFHQSREIVLMKIEEELPGVWAAETLVDGMPERLVIQLFEQGGRYGILECGERLRGAFELIDVCQVLVQASEGRWPELPMRIPRGKPIWLRNKTER